MQLSYEVAKKRKEKILRNLKALVLLSMGWEASPEILTYNQFKAILNFIREIQKIGSEITGDLKQLRSKNVNNQILDVMQGISRIDDWGITMVGNGHYRFHIFHLTSNKQPIIATFNIKLNNRNHIIVENCKRNEIVSIHHIPANVHIPKEMGKAL
ncbi:MAG: hypothetical protein Q8J62_06960 [Candidatus Cloacimonadaceae bacterium]|nr:hypothetical protein [Candidatus Cloacimonadaceae bacterium]